MRFERISIMLAALMVLITGPAASEDLMNVTDLTEAMNITEAPQEPVSRFTQLSSYTLGTAEVLGRSITEGYSDVTEVADTGAVFSREPGVPTPSVKVSITDVNTEGGRWVEVTNQAVGSWDITGWMLVSAGNATYVFPEFVLDSGKAVRVHEGSGAGTGSDLYTNSTSPLWLDGQVTLQNSEGAMISSYEIPAVPKKTVWVDPLAGLIQF